jgi:hypothetical protein
MDCRAWLAVIGIQGLNPWRLCVTMSRCVGDLRQRTFFIFIWTFIKFNIY